jgi:hypothetical protein
MPQQFKGTDIKVSNVEIKGRGQLGPVLSFTAVFLDKEGVVHGTVKHEMEVNNDKMISAVRQLIEALTEWATQAHFTGSPSQQERAVDGIAETLSRGAGSSEEPEKQG